MKPELKRRADRKLNGKLLGSPAFATVYSVTGVVDGTYKTMDEARAQRLHTGGLSIFIRGNKPLTAKQYNARLRAEEKDRLMAADKATARYIKDVKRLMDCYV